MLCLYLNTLATSGCLTLHTMYDIFKVAYMNVCCDQKTTGTSSKNLMHEEKYTFKQQ